MLKNEECDWKLESYWIKLNVLFRILFILSVHICFQEYLSQNTLAFDIKRLLYKRWWPKGSLDTRSKGYFRNYQCQKAL